jgi:DNA-binding NtrC family response regulator
MAIAALRAGINDYIRFPYEKDRIVRSLSGDVYTKKDFHIEQPRAPGFTRLVGEGQFARQLQVDLRRASTSDNNVLITGETGTGKELVAQLIHENSPRRNYPFECINCPALPDTLFESELFGYEKGAFTGAVTAYEGKLSQADKGTVFFDEIGDMSLLAQAKILRIIEGKLYYRLGGRRSIRPNVRFLMATNLDLEAMVGEGRFRADLFFRVNATRIHMAPLRERMEDFPLLLENMIQTLNEKYKRRVRRVPEDLVKLLVGYDWPGNIRELFNVMEATFANLDSDEIRSSDLPPMFLRKVTSVTPASSERQRLFEALRSTDWNLSEAARRLSLSRMTVYRKMAKFQISRGSNDPSGYRNALPNQATKRQTPAGRDIKVTKL